MMPSCAPRAGYIIGRRLRTFALKIENKMSPGGNCDRVL